MDEKPHVELITTNETVLRPNLIQHPQLTPTGKISHAKTRVYTQRYRKAWEQMPDFKGWLTSVLHQPTRAFCTYCKKNLHAHRLSLLKHTCTMKHQRCALMHQSEMNAKEAMAEEKIIEIEEELEDEPEDGEIQHQEEDGMEHEGDVEDDEEIDYVVERLDMDDEEEGDERHHKEQEEDEYEDEDEAPVVKKIKLEENMHAVAQVAVERNQSERLKSLRRAVDSGSRDALAEAMAHVHGEYLDENGESVNVELEMVVESVDPNAQEMQVVSILPEVQSDDNHMNIETIDQEELSHHNTSENEYRTREHSRNMGSKSSAEGDSSEPTSESEVLYQPPPRASPNFHHKSSNLHNRLSQLPPNSPITVTPIPNKTITFSSGGKTLTLTSSSSAKYTSGIQYVLSKSKGRLSAPIIAEKSEQAVDYNTGCSQPQPQSPTSYAVAGTSQMSPKKHIILKTVKPMSSKKPCISTHVLDTSKGVPVGGLQVSLYKLMEGRWTFINENTTTADGRCADLFSGSKYSFTAGRYKIHYDVDKYFTLRRIETLYPFIETVFDVKSATENYHMPVLLSPFGYTTYRGS